MKLITCNSCGNSNELHSTKADIFTCTDCNQIRTVAGLKYPYQNTAHYIPNYEKINQEIDNLLRRIDNNSIEKYTSLFQYNTTYKALGAYSFITANRLASFYYCESSKKEFILILQKNNELYQAIDITETLENDELAYMELLNSIAYKHKKYQVQSFEKVKTILLHGELPDWAPKQTTSELKILHSTGYWQLIAWVSARKILKVFLLKQ